MRERERPAVIVALLAVSRSVPLSRASTRTRDKLRLDRVSAAAATRASSRARTD
jgi:hypothetical protein